MLPQIESLLVLQDRDQRISSLEEDIKRIPNSKELAKQRLANDNELVANAKKAGQENEVAIKNLELDIGTRKNTLDRLKVQQYETKKNEEFTALENEIARYNQEVDDLETQELELMEKADSLRVDLQKAEAALTLTQGMVDEEIAQLDQRATEVKAQHEEVSSERAKLASEVDADLLSLYERLMSSKGGDAIVSAEKSQCHGCHMKVVPATMIKVQAEKEVAQCENCGRILHL
jgi:predicted  nucleic acid-binding Zn-ribbon protein